MWCLAFRFTITLYGSFLIWFIHLTCLTLLEYRVVVVVVVVASAVVLAAVVEMAVAAAAIVVVVAAAAAVVVLTLFVRDTKLVSDVADVCKML